MKNNQNKEIFYSAMLILVPLFVIFGFYFYTTHGQQESEIAIKTLPDNPQDIVLDTEPSTNPYNNVSITANAAIVKDLNTGKIIYSKNAYAPMPLASITKVMTALVAYTRDDPNKEVVISDFAISQLGEDSLNTGERFSMKSLLDWMLITSSNDGAAAISQSFETDKKTSFVAQMNTLASQIGMQSSYFLNSTGLDLNEKTPGAVGSAYDVVTMFEFITENYPELLEKTNDVTINTTSNNGISHSATNTNHVISEIDNIIASKTGFTDLAGGNLAVVVDPGLNRPVAIVVLGSTREGRFQDVLKLSKNLSEYFNFTE
jgi:D-alanyl-D-alanine carboxypeptidase